MFVVVLLLLNTSVEVGAIRNENISVNSLKIKEIYRSLVELTTSKNLKASMRSAPGGPNPRHHPPRSKYAPNKFGYTQTQYDKELTF